MQTKKKTQRLDNYIVLIGNFQQPRLELNCFRDHQLNKRLDRH